MAKFFTQNFTFSYPWEFVAFAICNRYPNPYTIPKWAEKIIPSKSVPILETVEIDLHRKDCKMIKTNILHQNFMHGTEICNYTQDPKNENKTICAKKVWVDSHAFGFANAIKKYGIEKYKINSNRAALGLDYVLNKISTSIPLNAQFNPQNGHSSSSVTTSQELDSLKQHYKSLHNQTFLQYLSSHVIGTGVKKGYWKTRIQSLTKLIPTNKFTAKIFSGTKIKIKNRTATPVIKTSQLTYIDRALIELSKTFYI